MLLRRRRAAPPPGARHARDALSRHYADELGEPFTTAGLCLYRDGHDSVAWHGDRIGRSRDQDTMVAILSVGAPRDLVLRPRGGGPSIRVPAGHGDLVVMGGSCQRTWDHCVPKTSKPVGPRISVQFRPPGFADRARITATRGRLFPAVARTGEPVELLEKDRPS